MKTIAKFFLMSVVFGSLLTLSGCFYSQNPIYTSKDITYDENLLGGWVRDNGNTALTFTRDGYEDRYRLSYRSGTSTQEYIAHLVQLDGRRFLDIYPASGGAPKKFAPVMPLHAVALVNLNGSTLTLSFVNSDWMSRGMVTLDQDLIYTGTTEETQQLLQKLINFQGEAFIPVGYHRQ